MQYDKLLVIGNGFDLALGLKTSYLDFMRWLKNEHYMDYAYLYRYLSSELNQKRWIDIENEFKKYVTNGDGTAYTGTFSTNADTNIKSILQNITGRGGMPATSGILALIRDLKSGDKWSFVTRNYNLPEVDHRNFVNDEFITRVCELFQNTPGSIDWPHAQVLQAVGIDPSVQDSATIHRFKSAISQIKKRKAYARIVSQYTF